MLDILAWRCALPIGPLATAVAKLPWVGELVAEPVLLEFSERAMRSNAF